MTHPGSAAEDPLDFSVPVTPTATLPVCSSCGTAISDQYWTAGPAVLCARCRETLAAGQSQASGLASRGRRFSRAALYGFAGMLAGSTVWYLVIKLADLQIGLIAILLGWLVAKGVLRGSGNRGGRRYQVLAVCLTYLGIGMAYFPFAVEAWLKDRPAAEVSRTLDPPPANASADVATLAPAEAEAEARRLDSVLAAEESAAAQTDGPRKSPGIIGLVTAAGLMVWSILTLPVLVLGDSGSIISVLIYGFALLQAWKLTAATRIEIGGPFQVGGVNPA